MTLHGPARNASVACAVLRALGVPGASDVDRLAQAAQGFDGLPSRCRSLGSVGAVEFVDDGLSTNVLPARAALQAFAERPVALLVGGHDRGLDYAPLGRAIAGRTAPTLVVTMPDNGPRIGQAVRDASGGGVEVIDAPSLDAAVEETRRRGAQTIGGGQAFQLHDTYGFPIDLTLEMALLSPAAPSFGRFGDYRERSAAFAKAAGRYGILS